MARWSRTCSAASSDDAGRVGSIAARQSTSSTSRLPRPATFDWSISTAFTGARLRRDDGAQLRQRDVHRVDTEAVLVGIELDGSQTRAGLGAPERPPSPNRSVKRCHSGTSRLLA